MNNKYYKKWKGFEKMKVPSKLIIGCLVLLVGTFSLSNLVFARFIGVNITVPSWDGSKKTYTVQSDAYTYLEDEKLEDIDKISVGNQLYFNDKIQGAAEERTKSKVREVTITISRTGDGNISGLWEAHSTHGYELKGDDFGKVFSYESFYWDSRLTPWNK